MLVGLCALTFLAGLGHPALADSDEAFYAESAREMIERADWLTPYYNEETRFEKPVLYYWMVAVTYLAAGPSPWAARLPAALSGIGLVFIAFLCARRWYDDGTALLAGVITATSFAAIAMARQALPDLTLAFFVTLAAWTALVGLGDERPGRAAPWRRRAWLLAAACAAAGAFLVKGPVGPVLVALVVGSVALVERWRCGSWWRVRPADAALAAAGFVLVAAPWYAAMAAEHGVAYLDRFFFAENLERFATARYNEPRPVWYYLPIVAGGMLPWSPFMLLWAPALRRAWRQRQLDATAVRLALWAAAPLALYTVSVGKQPRYILPMLAPLAILLARGIARALEAPPGARGLFAAAGCAAGAVIVLIGGLVHRARPLLVEWSDPVTIGLAAAIAISGVAVVATAAAALRAGPPRLALARSVPVLLAAASVVLAIGAHAVVLASPGPAPVERMAALLADARPAGEPYGRHRVFNRNLVYYTHAAHVELPIIESARDFLRSTERVLCVLRADDAARLEQSGLTLRRLGEVSYLNTGNLNLRTLLDPDPDRYLLRVVLATNR